jgi:hypothetical protein
MTQVRMESLHRNKYLIYTIIIDKHTKILCNYRLHVKQISEKQAGTSIRISQIRIEKKNRIPKVHLQTNVSLNYTINNYSFSTLLKKSNSK